MSSFSATFKSNDKDLLPHSDITGITGIAKNSARTLDRKSEKHSVSLTRRLIKAKGHERTNAKTGGSLNSNWETRGTQAERFTLMQSRDISILTTDGHPVAATLFEGNNKTGPVVIINSGVAIPRKVYCRFAKHLAKNGAAAVITYDYRGIDQPLPRQQSAKTSIFDWPEKDFTAVIDFAKANYPDRKLLGAGHSFGANLLGFTSSHAKFDRYLAIASGSGYIGFTKQKMKLGFLLNLIGPSASKLVGAFPKWLGFGSGMPLRAFQEWRKWFNDERYFMKDPRFAEKAHFNEVKIPIRFLNFADDQWVTEQSLKPISEWFSNAKLEFSWVTADQKRPEIGHFGFFKQINQSLWAEETKWLFQDC